jgi:putative oxidoreductase
MVLPWIRKAESVLAQGSSGVALAVRLGLAAVFAPSGWGKLLNLERTIGYFESLGIPGAQFQAPLAAVSELVLGVFLALGWYTRISAVPLMVIMAVAIRTAHWEDLDGWSSLLSLSDFLYLALLAGLATRGPGAFSLDRWIRKTNLN